MGMYEKVPGGGPACLICGHRRNRHGDSMTCLRSALDTIAAVVAQVSEGQPVPSDQAPTAPPDSAQSDQREIGVLDVTQAARYWPERNA